MKKILTTTSSFGKFDRTPIDMLESKGYEVIVNPHGRKLKKEEILELYPDIDGLIAGTEMIDEDAIACASKLKVISRCGSGVDSVDLNAVKKAGILFDYTPYGPTRAVAEMALALMLDLLRKVSLQDRALRDGTWKKHTGNLLYKKSIGIIGLGRIGKLLIELTKPFDLKYICYDKDPDEAFCEQHNVKISDLNNLLETSDIITLHVPYHKELENLIDQSAFEKMKSSAILVNLSRGKIVNEKDLFEALSHNRIKGAAMDVFEEEPYRGQLTTLENIIVTPHIGSAAVEGRIAMEIMAVENLIACFDKLD